MEMNHHAASSTEVCPTVSSPWLRQDDRLVVAEGVGQPLALLEVEHHAGVVVEQRVVAIEGAGVLGQGIEQPAKRGPGLAVDRMGVGRGDHVRPRRMDLGMDGEGGGVHGPIALDDLAALVDQDQILTRISLKFMPSGLTQKWSGSSGSRAVI